MDVHSGERDFFVSYRSADQAWAEWIAWELEDAGYTTFVQAWDFRPGQNFVHQMQQGASSCRRTIAVLTPAYFESGFTRAEWYSAFAKDPTGEAGLLLPVRVADCDITGLLGQIVYIDLVGLEKAQARNRLLAGIKECRAKPLQPPPFPDIFPDNNDIRVISLLPPPSAEDRRGLLILLNSVERDWIKGVLEQSVQHEALINLGMEARVDAIEHPWEQVLELPDAAGKLLPADTKIAHVFEDVGRLLLILGEPGSGKTMTLLELARDLVARANSDPRQPVPVVLNLSSWTERFTSLADWLTEELNSKYRIPKRIGGRWLEADRLMLLLDGLDEVQPDRRVACMRAINAFLEDQGTTGLVVCSRLAEYTAEPVRLKMNGAICLQPLTATQIVTYLSRLGSQLDALRVTLNKDDVLREMAKSPLMLSVMTLAYLGASTNALAGDVIETPRVRRWQVFNTYIDRMFARKGKAAGGAHAKEQTKSSLSWLAHNMQRHAQSIFLIEQMQPSWLNNVCQIFIYLLSSRLATVVAIWATIYVGINVVSLTLGDHQVPTQIVPTPIFFVLSPYYVILLLILTFLLGAFCSCCIDISRYHVETRLSTLRILRKVVNNPFLVIFAHTLGWTAVATIIHTLFPFAQQMSDSVAPFAFNGATLGFIFGILSCRRSVSRDIRIRDRLMWSWTGPIMVSIPASIVIASYYIMKFFVGPGPVHVDKDILEIAKIVSPLFGYPLVLSFVLWPPLFFLLGLRSAVREGKKIVNYGIKSALANACRVGLGMLTCGMLGFFIIIFEHKALLAPGGDVRIIGFGALLSIMAAVAIALSFGGVDVINHYVLRLIVYRNGYLPKGLHRFLDHCTKLVFLRRVGGGYIFVHRLLLEHFAAMSEAEDKQKGTKAAVTSGSVVAAPT